MKVAIADKPNETFPSASAPKKVLEMPLTPAAPAAKPAEDADPDADAPDADAPAVPAAPKAAPKVVAPVDGSGAAPVVRQMPLTTRPQSPTGKAPPAETHGVSHPPPD